MTKTEQTLKSEKDLAKDNYFQFVTEHDLKNKRPQINLTAELPRQTEYTLALENEYKHIAFSEVRSPKNKSFWRDQVFKAHPDSPIDVEIGTGAGTHFAYRAHKHPERFLVGLELKYKPLIQSIRRAQQQFGCKNVALCRFHAFNIDQLFDKSEINNVFIYFPDPWTSPRKPKNRVVNRIILNWIYEMQRPGSFLEFKTDSREYFLWALNEIKQTKYNIEFQTLNLYNENNVYFQNNFATTFEKIFTKQSIEINFIRLIKPN